MLEILTGRLYLLVLLEHPNQKWNLGWNVVYTCAENLDITSWTMPFLLYLLEFLIFWYLSFRPTLEKKMSLAMTVFLSLGVFLSNLSIQLPIDFYKTFLLEVYDVFEMTLGLWSFVIISRSSFQLKLHHRKSEQKRRSQSFSEVSSSLRGFYEMVLVQNVCGKSQKIWDQRKKRNESIQGRPWRRGYKWRCWWRDRSELSSAY